MCNALYLGRDGVGGLEAEDVDADEDRHGVASCVVYRESDDKEEGKPCELIDILQEP